MDNEKPEKVRLQIPIDSSLAREISELAENMRRSRSWMAGELLAVAVEQREKVYEWIGWRLGIAVASKFKRRTRKEKSGEAEYLQVIIDSELALKLDHMAEKAGSATGKFAGMILDSAVEDHEWLIRIVSDWRVIQAVEWVNRGPEQTSRQTRGHGKDVKSPRRSLGSG